MISWSANNNFVLLRGDASNPGLPLKGNNGEKQNGLPELQDLNAPATEDSSATVAVSRNKIFCDRKKISLSKFVDLARFKKKFNKKLCLESDYCWFCLSGMNYKTEQFLKHLQQKSFTWKNT